MDIHEALVSALVAEARQLPEHHVPLDALLVEDSGGDSADYRVVLEEILRDAGARGAQVRPQGGRYPETLTCLCRCMLQAQGAHVPLSTPMTTCKAYDKQRLRTTYLLLRRPSRCRWACWAARASARAACWSTCCWHTWKTQPPTQRGSRRRAAPLLRASWSRLFAICRWSN